MSKPTIKGLQAELYELRAKHARLLSANDSNIKEIVRLKGSPKVQEQLNMANGTVAELMKEVETLKKEKDNFERNYNKVNESYEQLYETHVETTKENEKLKFDYALLEEKYYTQMDCYTEVNKELSEMIDSHNKVTAENERIKSDYIELEKMYNDYINRTVKIEYENDALKAEIERTNRHINLAENQLNKEQQPLVVNHYHNCVINK